MDDNKWSLDARVGRRRKENWRRGDKRGSQGSCPWIDLQEASRAPSCPAPGSYWPLVPRSHPGSARLQTPPPPHAQGNQPSGGRGRAREGWGGSAGLGTLSPGSPKSSLLLPQDPLPSEGCAWHLALAHWQVQGETGTDTDRKTRGSPIFKRSEWPVRPGADGCP